MVQLVHQQLLARLDLLARGHFALGRQPRLPLPPGRRGHQQGGHRAAHQKGPGQLARGAGREVRTGPVDRRPPPAGHLDLAHRPQAVSPFGRSVAGAEQQVLRLRIALVDRVAVGSAVHLVEHRLQQIPGPERAVDEALEGGAARLRRVRDAAARIDRDIDQEAGLLLLVNLLDQLDLARHGRQAAVARPGHRLASRGIGIHVEAQGRAVPVVLRLQVEDGVPLVGRGIFAALQGVARTPGRPLARLEGSLAARRQTGRIADALDARITLAQFDPPGEGLELSVGDLVARREEAGPGLQYGHIGAQAGDDGVIGLVDEGVEALALARLPQPFDQQAAGQGGEQAQDHDHDRQGRYGEAASGQVIPGEVVGQRGPPC